MKKLLPILFCLICTAISAAAQQSPPASAPKLSYGIVVDNSGSYRSLLEQIVTSVKSIVDAGAPGDEIFLTRFVDSSKIKILQDLTVDKDELRDAADQLYIEGGLTSIVDAVDFSAKYLTEKSAPDAGSTKILILITDGDERQSSAKIDDVTAYLKQNQIRVYALGIAEEKVSTKVLDKLTKATGGKTFVAKRRADIEATIKSLTDSLRNQ